MCLLICTLFLPQYVEKHINKGFQRNYQPYLGKVCNNNFSIFIPMKFNGTFIYYLVT